MDRDTAIASFLEQVDHLARLPFITDLEFKELYGEEVAAAFGELERINQEERICQQCNSNCCQEHGCEFYAPQFSQCPVQDLRPAICRFHFCEKYQVRGGSAIKELSEIFLYSLSTAAASGSGNVKFFNPPPFASVLPELVAIINPLINRVQSGDLKPGYGQRRIRQEVMKYIMAGNVAPQENIMKVIGVVGLNGSGKDEVVKYLHKQYGVPLISVGDIVREIAAQESIEPTRDNLDEITRRYFTQFGKGYFLKLVVEKIRQNKWKSAGISGIRSPEDVFIMQEAFGNDFILIHVYITDPQVRYERMQKRGSKRDAITFEDLLKQDKVSEELFHVGEVTGMADYSISNDGTLEDMYRQTQKLISDNKLLG